ncbi:MAG: tail fiber protein [Myxococcota bacterium]|nr:tail fiber protein [Myxococcota bacterium]
MTRWAMAAWLFLMAGCACEENDWDGTNWDDSQETATKAEEAEKTKCVRYVDQDAEPEGDGKSWTTAHQSLESAIDVINTGVDKTNLCEVLVKGEAVDSEALATSISPNIRVKVYDGFSSNETQVPIAKRRAPVFDSGAVPIDREESMIQGLEHHTIAYITQSDTGNLTAFTADKDILYPQNALRGELECPDSFMNICANSFIVDGRGGYRDVHVGYSNKLMDLMVWGKINTTESDLVNNLGRAAIGYCGHADYAAFAHYDQNNTTSYALLQHRLGHTYLNAASGREMLFRIGNQDKMRLKPNGNFGIGTTTPAAKLEVAKTASSANEDAIRIGVDGERRSAITFYDDDAETSQWFKIQWNAAGEDLHFGHYDTADIMTITNTGRVGIRTTSPDHELSVHGTIQAEEVIVEQFSADYVFGDNYDLWSLDEVEEYIEENSHLPGIPSAEETAQEGVSLGDANARLLQKIEELTLHLIAQNKQMIAQSKRISELEQRIARGNN